MLLGYKVFDYIKSPIPSSPTIIDSKKYITIFASEVSSLIGFNKWKPKADTMVSIWRRTKPVQFDATLKKLGVLEVSAKELVTTITELQGKKYHVICATDPLGDRRHNDRDCKEINKFLQQDLLD
jgi:hypothetical protein